MKVIIKLAGAKHLYVVQTQIGDIDVEANNRDQAGRLAEKAGYQVRSMFMEG